MLVRQLGQRALREAMDSVRPSEYVKLTPTQMYDALAKFRTPGQSLLPSRDVRRLWEKCDCGDPAVFLRIFRDHEAAGEAGATFKAAASSSSKKETKSAWAAPRAGGPKIPARVKERRRKGTDAATYPHASDDVKGAAASAEALRLRYKTSRTLVQPPVGSGAETNRRIEGLSADASTAVPPTVRFPRRSAGGRRTSPPP